MIKRNIAHIKSYALGPSNLAVIDFDLGINVDIWAVMSDRRLVLSILT